MQHGGGGGWLSGGALTIVCVAAVLVCLLLWYRRRKAQAAAGRHVWRNIVRMGCPMIAFDAKQQTQRNASSMAEKLWSLHAKVWSMCQRVYCKRLDPCLNLIVLNRGYTYDGQPAPIKLYLRAGHLHMRPTGTLHMYMLFALEVHQLFRAYHLGFDHCNKPAPGDIDDLKHWATAVSRCKEIAGGFA